MGQPLKRSIGRAWQRWKTIAHRLGNFQARVLLSLFYFLVVPPFALIVKLSRDPLGLRPHRTDGFWHRRRPAEPAVEAARKQF
jgi:hypothetical protein